MKRTIIGAPLPNIPWEEKPEDCRDVLWRYSGNPILDWNPIPKAARIFNSAVLRPTLGNTFKSSIQTKGVDRSSMRPTTPFQLPCV